MKSTPIPSIETINLRVAFFNSIINAIFLQPWGAFWRLFLLNIQLMRCKLGAIILFNYLKISKSSGKMCIRHSLCSWFFNICCSKHCFLPFNLLRYHDRHVTRKKEVVEVKFIPSHIQQNRKVAVFLYHTQNNIKPLAPELFF